MQTWMRTSLYDMFYRLTGRSDVLRNLHALRASHTSPPHELDALVRQRVATLLRRAVDHVPYYRDLAAASGLAVRESTVLKDLHDWPVLDKNAVRREGGRLHSEQAGGDVYRNTSGGSTGEPVTLLQDQTYKHWSFANKILFLEWTGYRRGQRHLKLWGAKRDMLYQGGVRAWLHRNVLRESLISCYEVSDSEWHRLAEQLRRQQPAVIEAYADAAYDFARFLLHEGVRVPAPNGMVTSAGVLTQRMRSTMQTAFGCPVLNRYGSREVGDIACGCPEGEGLHVSPLTHYVEVVNGEGQPCPPGEEGDLLITLLTNHSMPLIRYRIEDRGALAAAPCTCGRHSLRLEAVVGRSNDFLSTQDGRRINGTAITTLLYGVQGVGRYQWRQQAEGAVTLQIVPTPDADLRRLQHDTKPALSKLRGMLGGDQDVRLEIVAGIPTTATGKHRYVVNECEPAVAVSS